MVILCSFNFQWLAVAAFGRSRGEDFDIVFFNTSGYFGSLNFQWLAVAAFGSSKSEGSHLTCIQYVLMVQRCWHGCALQHLLQIKWYAVWYSANFSQYYQYSYNSVVVGPRLRGLGPLTISHDTA